MAAYDLTALSTALEFDTVQGQFNQVLTWSTTRVIIAWNGSSDSKGLVRAFDVNAGTGAITGVGTALSIDGLTNEMNGCSIVAFDSTHFILIWRDGTDVRVKARAFAVDGSGNITTAGAILSLTDITNQPTGVLIDSTHILVVGSGSANDGYSKVLAVNTGTWAITQAGSATEFDTTDFSGYNGGPMAQKVDATHVVVSWFQSGGGGLSQVLSINTGTWAVTAEGTPLTFDASNVQYVGVTPLDGVNHYLVTYRDDGSTGDGKAQVIEVNTSTWAVTNVGTPYTFDTGSIDYKGTCQVDSTHVALIWGESNNGYSVILAVNGSWVVSQPGAKLEVVGGNIAFDYCGMCLIDTARLVGVWGGSAADGYTQAFDIEQQSGPANVKTVDGVAVASVKTWDGITWADVKTFNGIS